MYPHLMKRSEILFGLLKIPVDFASVLIAFLVAYKLRILTESFSFIAKEIDYSVLPTLTEYLNFSMLMSLLLILVAAFGNMYGMKSTLSFSKEFKKVFIVVFIWVMLTITYFYFTRTFPFSRLAMMYSWAISFVFLVSGRAFIRILQNILLKTGVGKRRVLFIGNNKITQELLESFKKNQNYHVVGIVGQALPNEEHTPHLLGPITELIDIAKRNHVEEVIQTTQDISEARSKDILEYCEEFHIEYTFVPDIMQVQRTNVDIKMTRGIPLITLKKTSLEGWGKITKRTMDITGSTLGLIILSPVLALIAVIVKLDSKGPVLYSAKRIGQHGKPFTCHKFRSMKTGSHEQRYSEEFKSQNLRAGSPLVKIANDPRVTKFGKFIRKYSIDELPQLWNIWVGKMSMVGPRPHLPEEVAQYKRHHKFVLTIKPGLTGMPQTSGRSDLDFEREVKLDRFYIEHWSIWLDIKTILKTIGIVLKGYKE